MIGAVIYGVLRKFKLGFYASTISSIILVLMYGLLTNFSVSTKRAVIMFSIMLLARLLGKSYDLLSALSFAGLWILIEEPMKLFSVGFLLSFGAIIGIGVVLPGIRKVIPWKNKMMEALLVSFSTQIATLPLIMFFFYQVPVYGIIMNLIILPTTAVLLLSGLVAGILGCIYLPLGVFLIGGTNYILKLFEGICRLGEKLPGYLYTTGRPYVHQIIIFVLLTILFLFLSHRKPKVYLLAMPILALGILLYPKQIHGLEVTFVDVGQGDGIHIRSESGRNYLVDGGSSSVKSVGKNRIQPYLLYQGVDQIEYAFLSHGDEDHVNGIKELIANGRILVKNLVLPKIDVVTIEDDKSNLTKKEKSSKEYEDLITFARNHNILVSYMGEGDMMQDGELVISCLHPSRGYQYQSSNDYSLVLDVTYGAFDMLLTGDLEKSGEDRLLKEVFVESKEIVNGILSTDSKVIDFWSIRKEYDVLKVAHHGSKNSTYYEFLSIIKPTYALISCGERNSYGHPHGDLIERLKTVESEIIITYESGAVTLYTDGEILRKSEFLGK